MPRFVCGRCGKSNAFIYGSRNTCLDCFVKVEKYPARCTACELDGYPLTSVAYHMNSSGSDETSDLCPTCLDEFSARTYTILILNGEDLGSEGFDYDHVWDEVGLLVSQPDMHQYFPLVIERVNRAYDIHETVAVVRLP